MSGFSTPIRALINQKTGFASLILASILLNGCEKAKKEDHWVLMQYVEAKGSCYEDHVKRPAPYVGSLVDWYDQDKRIHLIYGSVDSLASMDINKMITSMDAPHTYRPPFDISFWMVPEKELAQKSMVLKGLSERPDPNDNDRNFGPKYRSTCHLTVTKRLDHIPAVSDGPVMKSFERINK